MQGGGQQTHRIRKKGEPSVEPFKDDLRNKQGNPYRRSERKQLTLHGAQLEGKAQVKDRVEE